MNGREKEPIVRLPISLLREPRDSRAGLIIHHEHTWVSEIFLLFYIIMVVKVIAIDILVSPSHS